MAQNILRCPDVGACAVGARQDSPRRLLMTIRPEEDPGYFDEFVSEEIRTQLHRQQQCKKHSAEAPDDDVECLEGEEVAPSPDDA